MTKENTKHRPSLRKFVLIAVISAIILLIATYSALVIVFFTAAFKTGVENTLYLWSEDYLQSYRVDPNTIPYSSEQVFAYRSLEDMPEELLALFPPKTHRHGKSRVIKKEQWPWSDPNPTHVSFEKKYCPSGCFRIGFYPHHLDGDDWLYLVVISLKPESVAAFDSSRNKLMMISPIVVLASILACLAVLYKINRPIKQLTSWADSLERDNYSPPPKDLKYIELQSIADKLYGTIGRMLETVENEQRFLSNASHELRTPLAIIAGNLELMTRSAEAHPLSPIQEKSVIRLQRAVTDMKQMMETLLWLSREKETLPGNQVVDLHKLTNEIIQEHNYLLEHKPVTIEFEGSSDKVHVPHTACRIVIANLIRNAFQYTHEGTIRIAFSDASLTISNPCTENPTESENTSPGFGLGLRLVESIADKADWHVEKNTKKYEDGLFTWDIKVVFDPHLNS